MSAPSLRSIPQRRPPSRLLYLWLDLERSWITTHPKTRDTRTHDYNAGCCGWASGVEVVVGRLAWGVYLRPRRPLPVIPSTLTFKRSAFTDDIFPDQISSHRTPQIHSNDIVETGVLANTSTIQRSVRHFSTSHHCTRPPLGLRSSLSIRTATVSMVQSDTQAWIRDEESLYFHDVCPFARYPFYKPSPFNCIHVCMGEFRFLLFAPFFRINSLSY